MFISIAKHIVTVSFIFERVSVSFGFLNQVSLYYHYP